MKKILILFIFPLFLFSDSPSDCEYTAPDDAVYIYESYGAGMTPNLKDHECDSEDYLQVFCDGSTDGTGNFIVTEKRRTCKTNPDYPDTSSAEFTRYEELNSYIYCTDNYVYSHSASKCVSACSADEDEISGQCYAKCENNKVRNDDGECVAPISCPSDNPFIQEITSHDTAMDCQFFVGIETGQGAGDSTGSTAIELYSYREDGWYSKDVDGTLIDIYQVCCYQTVGNSKSSDNNSTDDGSTNNDDNSSDSSEDSSNDNSSGDSDDSGSDNGDSDSLNENNADSNATNDSATNSDSNNTNSNSSDGLTGDILDSITASSELAHKDTQRIIDAVTSSSTTAHEDASAIKQHLQDIKNSSHADSTMLRDTMNSNSGVAHTDATDIKNAVDTASATAHEDAVAIKEAVEDITGLSDEDKNSLNNAKDSISDSTNTANNNYSSVIDSFNTLLTAYSNTPPVFKGTGNHVFSTTVYGSDVRFDLSLFGDLKPYFDIVFLLMLAWINFKIYRWIFEFLIRIGV